MINEIKTDKKTDGGALIVTVSEIIGTRISPYFVSGFSDKDCDVQILDENDNIKYQMPVFAYEPFHYPVTFTGNNGENLRAKITDSTALAYLNFSCDRG